MKTLVIVGAGPGLSLSIAKKFGSKGFRIALIARREDKLKEYVSILSDNKIDAASFVADVTEERQLDEAFTKIKEKFDQIDVLLYNAAVIAPISATQTTAELANEHFQVNVIGAISSAQQVIPEMIERKQGAIFFTGGGDSELTATPFLTTLSIGKSGLRSYAHCLHDELAEKGIYVGMVSIAGQIKEGTYFAPDNIAETYVSMYEKQDRVEEFYIEDNHDSVEDLRASFNEQ